MKKLAAVLLIILVVLMLLFSTWQLYRGNLEAAFSVAPFILVIYFLVVRQKS